MFIPKYIVKISAARRGCLFVRSASHNLAQTIWCAAETRRVPKGESSWGEEEFLTRPSAVQVFWTACSVLFWWTFFWQGCLDILYKARTVCTLDDNRCQSSTFFFFACSFVDGSCACMVPRICIQWGTPSIPYTRSDMSFDPFVHQNDILTHRKTGYKELDIFQLMYIIPYLYQKISLTF